MEVSEKAELEGSQPFTAPFNIHNSGYLPFHIQRAICYAAKIKVGGITLEGDMMGNEVPKEELERGHNETIFCRFSHSDSPPSEASIAIVVDYTPWGFPLSYTSRQYFCLTGAYGDTWDWIENPCPSSTKEGADRILQRTPSS
jgi:hypothetical protein